MNQYLEKKSQSPLYQQLMHRLKNDISAGVYPAGGRIPSEQVLCDTYGVSRVTVRKAPSWCPSARRMLSCWICPWMRRCWSCAGCA